MTLTQADLADLQATWGLTFDRLYRTTSMDEIAARVYRAVYVYERTEDYLRQWLRAAGVLK